MSSKESKRWPFKNYSPRRPLKLSIQAFCQKLPRSMKTVLVPFEAAPARYGKGDALGSVVKAHVGGRASLNTAHEGERVTPIPVVSDAIDHT
jgi:hypothetical protein